MRRLRIHPTVYVVFLLTQLMHAQVQTELDAFLDEVKEHLAPDSRTKRFDVRIAVVKDTVVLEGEVHDASMKQEVLRRFHGFRDDRLRGMHVREGLVALPHPSLGERTYGIVTVSVASIRTQPGNAQELATQALLGTPLRVLHWRNGWYLVQTPDEYLGWMDDGLVLFTKEGFNAWTRQPKVIVTATFAHTMASPSSDGEIVSDVVAGGIVKLVSEEGAWYSVEYPDGRRGFLPRTAAEPLAMWLVNRSEAPEKIIATAKRFMGVPYLWGGTSPKAMDCSGFTKTVFFLHGMMLPRDASQQARVGIPITPAANFENIRMGDLLLFGTSHDRSQRERVTHVGIYLGNGRFIHESEDVRINSLHPHDSLYSPRRAEMLLRAVRVIGVGEDFGVRRLSSFPYYQCHEQP